MRLPLRKTSRKEIFDIVKATLAISLAFTILNLRGIRASSNIITYFLISFITAGFAFIIHEMAHKITAQNYGLYAEFRADDKMLLFAIASAFFGFLFAAPGGVMIGHPNKKQQGNISIAGPLSNFILAIPFLALTLTNLPLFSAIGYYGASINLWLSIFNMIPIGNLDGKKVLKTKPKSYYVLISLSVLAFIILQSS